MDDEVHGWISEGEPHAGDGGGLRNLTVLLAVSAVVGVVAGAALMRSWDDDFWPFPSPPVLDLQVSAGATDAWIAEPDRGAGGIAIIPLVLTNEGNRPIILTQVQVAGVATKLSMNPTYSINGEIPETLHPGLFSTLQIPVSFDCSENLQPDPIVTFVGRQQNGRQQHLVVHPADLVDHGGMWGSEGACGLRYIG